MPSRVALALLAVLAIAVTSSTRAEVAPPTEPLVYVALGASDTVGAGTDDPSREGWVAVLHGYLPPGTELVNLGVNGMKLHEAVEQVLPVAVDARPDVVTVWLAVNDFRGGVSLERYTRDLSRLLAALDSAGARTVLVGNLPDLVRLPGFGAGEQPGEAMGAEVERWNAAIARTVADHGAVLVDIHSGSEEIARHPEYFAPDGGHPSAIGYRRLAEFYWAALESHLGSETATR